MSYLTPRSSEPVSFDLLFALAEACRISIPAEDVAPVAASLADQLAAMEARPGTGTNHMTGERATDTEAGGEKRDGPSWRRGGENRAGGTGAGTTAEAAGQTGSRGIAGRGESARAGAAPRRAAGCAYARVLADSARDTAASVDRDLAQGRWRGPLHGVPIAVKDICFTAGVPTEAGSRVRAGFVPDYDATIVGLLKAAGAVVIGKSETHEFAYGVNTPPTRTPWDLECYPGGSSTGSGVAVSVRSAFGGIGTDTGGSIRVPASINGIVGLKPTFGRVSRYGVEALATSLDHVGPMTRTVEDCAILLQAIAGYDPRDSGSVAEPVPDYRAELESGVEGLTVGVERDYFFTTA